MNDLLVNFALAAFCQRAGIKTKLLSDLDGLSDAWIALIPVITMRDMSIEEILADHERWYQQIGWSATGPTKEDAVKALCEQVRIRYER